VGGERGEGAGNIARFFPFPWSGFPVCISSRFHRFSRRIRAIKTFRRSGLRLRAGANRCEIESFDPRGVRERRRTMQKKRGARARRIVSRLLSSHVDRFVANVTEITATFRRRYSIGARASLSSSLYLSFHSSIGKPPQAPPGTRKIHKSCPVRVRLFSCTSGIFYLSSKDF
jgi:hypothetical protein